MLRTEKVMSIQLTPDVEAGLVSEAAARGLSVDVLVCSAWLATSGCGESSGVRCGKPAGPETWHSTGSHPAAVPLHCPPSFNSRRFEIPKPLLLDS